MSKTQNFLEYRQPPAVAEDVRIKWAVPVEQGASVTVQQRGMAWRSLVRPSGHRGTALFGEQRLAGDR